jgi:RNA polymerase sigma-70 factor (ECF subfamily)
LRAGMQEDAPKQGRRDAVLPVSPRRETADSRLVTLAVGRAQAGERDALAFLYARFADDVCRYARSVLHKQHEAEDVTQQVFAKLLGVIGSYEQRDVPFLAWLLRVTRNVAIDQLRRQRAIPVPEVRASVPPWDPSSSATAKELTAALAALPPAQREVLVLRHFVGLSPGEIATRTGRSEGAVTGLHHRGRKALIRDLTSRGAAPVTSSARSTPQPSP